MTTDVALSPLASRTVASRGREHRMSGVEGSGTQQDPWILTTPPGRSEYEAYRDAAGAPPGPGARGVQVGPTELRYHLRCTDDRRAMLRERGDWMPLGNTDEQKEAP